MKRIHVFLFATLFFVSSSVVAQQKECTTEKVTKERVDCPAGTDMGSKKDINEKCRTVRETERRVSCKEGGNGRTGNASGSSSRRSEGGHGRMSRAADNGSKH